MTKCKPCALASKLEWEANKPVKRIRKTTKQPGLTALEEREKEHEEARFANEGARIEREKATRKLSAHERSLTT